MIAKNDIEADHHQPVMLNEVLQALSVYPSGIYIDATYGRGGHSRGILRRLNARGQLLVMDRDLCAYHHAKQMFANDQRITASHRHFSKLSDLAFENGVLGSVNGIIFDLGVSSPLLTDPNRGFSFLRDGPLDMRMDTSCGMTAAQWLAKVDRVTLSKILKEYGEERYAKRIATAIVNARKEQQLTSTIQLANIIVKASPSHDYNKHPATRSFQAIRIFINRELDELTQALNQALEVLAVGGRLVVISFHSLEDRIVKEFIYKNTHGESLPRGLPVVESNICRRLQKINGVIYPSAMEVKLNRRSRSAVLRVAEKLS